MNAPPAVETGLGSDRRDDKTQTYGGKPVTDFMAAAMHALRHAIFEEAVGTAKESREKSVAVFEIRNQIFKG